MANQTKSKRIGNQKGTRESFGVVRVFYRHKNKRITERAFKALPAQTRSKVSRTARYYASYTRDGATYTPGVSYGAKNDASGWLAGERKLMDLGVWTPPKERERKTKAEKTTLGEFFEEWLPQDERKTTTQTTYRSLYNNRVKAYLGHRVLNEISEEDINEWWKQLKADYPKTPSRNASAYTLVATLFNKVVREKKTGVTVSPCNVVKATKKPEPKEKDLLTDEEFSQLIEALPERYRMAVVIAEHCQLRISEWTELRRKDLTVKKTNGQTRATLNVSRRVAWVGGQPDYSTPKSEKGNRKIFVAPAVVPALLAYVEKFSQPGAEGLLFVNEDGNQIRHTRFREMLANHSMKLFGRRVGSHEFRHRGATEFARAGATLKDLMARLGHSTTEMALTYQHAAEERDRMLTEKMPVPWLPEVGDESKENGNEK